MTATFLTDDGQVGVVVVELQPPLVFTLLELIGDGSRVIATAILTDNSFDAVRLRESSAEP